MKFKVLLSLIILSVFWSCQEDESLDTNTNNYTFAPTFTIENNSTNVNCFDTVWINSTIPGYLYDEVTNEKVYFLDAIIYLNFMVRAWSGQANPIVTNSVGLVYETYSPYNVLVEHLSMSGVWYEYKDTAFRTRIGVIFYEPGVYSLDFDNTLVFNHNTNTYETYGGGRISFYDVDWVEHSGYVYPNFGGSANIEAYKTLTLTEQQRFNPIDSANMNKYFFINALANEN